MSQTAPVPDETPYPLPVPSAAMQTDDEAGARAAAEYFFAVYAYMYNTGDVDQFSALSFADCVFCNNSVEDVKRLYAGGGFLRGGEISIPAATVFERVPDSSAFTFDAELSRSAAQRQDGGGSVVDEPAGTFGAKGGLVVLDGQWRFLDLESKPS